MPTYTKVLGIVRRVKRTTKEDATDDAVSHLGVLDDIHNLNFASAMQRTDRPFQFS